MSQLFASDDHNTGPSASASVLPTSIQGWFPLRLTGLISLLSKRFARSLLQHYSWKASILWHSAFFTVQLLEPYVTTGKTIALPIRTFASRVMSLLFNTLSRFVITFLPRSNCLLTSWLQLPSAVIFRVQEEEICHYFHLFPFYLPWSNGAGCMILVFLIFSFKPALSVSSLTLIKRLLRFSLLSAIGVVSSAYLRLLMFLPPVSLPVHYTKYHSNRQSWGKSLAPEECPPGQLQ